MWYLNETNTEVVTIAEVRKGDIITMNTEPRHGFKVSDIYGSRKPGKRDIRSSGMRWQADTGREVLRLLKNADGTVKVATNR